jgi:hypothetical protein
MKGNKDGLVDAFARALKETFGDHASLEKIAQARVLYARHRTDDLLKRLNGAVSGKNGRARPPGDGPAGGPQ